MKTYLVQVPVESAVGFQMFSVEANTESEALAKVRNGEGEFSHEEIDIQKLDMDSARVYEEESAARTPGEGGR